ncbi:MAG: alpha-E domain-containing protein [Acidimicrobiales bacterium]
MLSRIAESLYWVGRYVERAEDTARILDVQLHHILEEPELEEEAACRAILAVMGRKPPPGPVDAGDVARVLAFDVADPCSIVGSFNAARENARGAREVLSSEMWECLNTTYNALPARASAAAASGGLHDFFQYVKERATIVAGLADSTMTRDDGWRFLVLGRSLERIDMTTRLLSARFGHPSSSPAWITALRSCSAHEAFLRTYRRAVEPGLAVEFLLLDRLFPRSVHFTLDAAESSLAELDPSTGRVGMDNEARRILGRVRYDLEFANASELMADLPERLSSLQAACAQAAAAVAGRFFRQTAAVSWQLEGSAAR